MVASTTPFSGFHCGELNAALIWAFPEVVAAAAWFGCILSELADIVMKPHLAL